MTRFAEPGDVERAVDQQWSRAQLHCRTYGHTWRPHTVWHRPGQYTVVQRCSRCHNKRHQRIDEYGYPMSSWQHEYRDGYLLDDNGRIGADGRAVLRLSALSTLAIYEEPEEDDA